MAVKKIENFNIHENPATNENEFDIENYLNANWNKIKEVVDNNADELSEAQENIAELQEDNETNKTNIANKVDKVEGKGLSTEDFTTELKTKLEGLNNYDDTEIKEDIAEIQTEQTSQNEKIEKIEDNQIHLETEQSSTINVQDCSNLSAKIDVFGVSSQETRSGKNLLDISLLAKELTNGISYTYENDKIHVEGTATAIALSNVANVTDKLEIGKKYILSLNKSNGDNVIATASIQYNDGTPQSWVSSFMFAENMQAVNIYLQVSSGATVNVDVTAQLEEGDVATEYEKYGASPSPEFPSEIENIEGDIDTTVCNKNFLPYPYDNVTNTIIQDLEDGRLILNGSIDTNISRTIKTFDLKAGNYKFLFNTSNLPNTSYFYIRNEATKVMLKSNIRTNTTFNLEEDTNIRIELVLVAGEYSNFELDLMILNATEVNEEWKAHEEQLITFPLQENQKMMEGSETKDDGIHHKRKQIELDGTEDWFIGSITSLRYSIRLELQDIKLKTTNLITEILSNCFLRDGSSENSTGYENKFTFRQANGSRNLWFFIPKNFFTTTTSTKILEEWKAYLSAQKIAGTPVTIEYPLAEEEIVELYTEEQQEVYNQLQNITPYKLVTNISTDKAKLVFKYIADTKTYVDNEINSIKEQLKTVNELLSTTKTSAMLLDNMQTDLESEVL